MALEVKLDEVTRSQFEADTNGIRYLQAGVAIGLTESDPAKLLATIPNLPGVPPLGTEHKLYPSAMVNGYRVTGIGDREVSFVVVYESPAGYGLNFIVGQWYAKRSCSISEVETWLDAGNNPITVEYKAPGAAAPSVRQSSARKRIGHIDLTLTGVFKNGVTSQQEAAVGKINKLAWYRKPPFTWLCVGCTERPEILGLTWRITAAFVNNSSTWDGYARQIDPNTGRPPDDITPADVQALVALNMTALQTRKNGVTRIRLNEAIDFATLFGTE